MGSGTSALLVTCLLLSVGGYGFWKAFWNNESLKVEVTEDERTDVVDGADRPHKIPIPSMHPATSYDKAAQILTDRKLSIVVSGNHDADVQDFQQEHRTSERTSPQSPNRSPERGTIIEGGNLDSASGQKSPNSQQSGESDPGRRRLLHDLAKLAC